MTLITACDCVHGSFAPQKTVALWLAYGVLLGQWPLIATNSICLGLAAFIRVMKILPASGQPRRGRHP